MKAIGATTRNLRIINRGMILTALRSRESLSVSDVSRITGLSLVTCANALADMALRGEAIELEERESRGGRPARFYAINPDYQLVAALTIKPAKGGKASFAHAVLNGNAETVDSGTTLENEARAAEAIDAILKKLIARYPNLASVAISIPGIAGKSGIEDCDLPALAGIDLEKRINSAFGLETAVDNDANYAAVGCLRRLARDDVGSLVYMIFPERHRMGAGIVVNGVLVRGRTGFAGELSYSPLGEGEGKKLAPPAEYMAMMAATVTTVVNPDVIVLSGGATARVDVRDVRERCLGFIPERHLPELLVRRDYDDDSLAGMMTLAFNFTACAVRLVETEKGSAL